jgi:cardiolipin synthase C
MKRFSECRLPLFVLAACVLLLAVSPRASPQSINDWIESNCAPCVTLMAQKTGVYILDKGEESMMGRAWLAQHARQSIDVQYFIWSSDNIGILATEMLLQAADRGVRVRVVVDDITLDVKDETLIALAAHSKVQIRVYNPKLMTGVSLLQKIINTITDFRGINQRMHDKTAIYDGLAGITGGRNMADEYFDFNHKYNFRDRDVVLIGPAVEQMTDNFNEFWDSDLAVPVEEQLKDVDQRIAAEDVERRYAELHAYAADPVNFEPEIRNAIEEMPKAFPALLQNMAWEDARFISDKPGKNPGLEGFGGGGESTQALVAAIRDAQHSILIQSPYLILPTGGIELLAELHKRGVRIRISTNSLASTDNLAAFSGYFKQRTRLLQAGVELYEYKPYPKIQMDLLERYPRLADNNPVFALHAKSMVIDGSKIFIGTFNLDPRSANLNTEVGVLVDSPQLGQQLTASIERDIRAENSWHTTKKFNPDREVSRGKYLKLGLFNLLPLDPVL